MDDGSSELRCEVCGKPLRDDNKLGVCAEKGQPECAKLRRRREREERQRNAPPKPESNRCKICGKPIRSDNKTGLCDGKGSPECKAARNNLQPRPERPPTPEAPRCDVCGCKLTRNNVYGVCNGHGKPACRHERYRRERDGLVGEKRLLIAAGDTFGRWTVLENSHFMGDFPLCRCECGTEREVSTKNLVGDLSHSCGCAPRRAVKFSGPYIAAGTVFGRLTVLDDVPRSTGNPRARCICECGTEITTAALSVKHGSTRSCGCLRRDVLSKRGGFTKHPLYKIWTAMVRRCTDPKADSYPNYGGRGIKVCDRWMDPWLFAEDIEREIGPRPEGTYESGAPLYTLDRINNDADYCSGNVRWSTQKEQVANQRTVAGVTEILTAQIEDLTAQLAALTAQREAALHGAPSKHKAPIAPQDATLF